jgi:hypothetical protein
VEERTGLNKLLRGLAEQTELENSPLFLRWIQRSVSLIGLRIAATAHSLQQASGQAEPSVNAALDHLGWREVSTLRVIHQTEWGQRRIEKVIAIVGRLEEAWVLERVGRDVAA